MLQKWINLKRIILLTIMRMYYCNLNMGKHNKNKKLNEYNGEVRTIKCNDSI